MPRGYRLNALWRDFWSHSVLQPSGCREWQRSTGHFGYGVVRYRGRNQYAHTVAWQKVRGAIPAGLLVLHECDNAKCVAPEHLYLGTYQDNAMDREWRNRGREDKRQNGMTRIAYRDALRARVMRDYGADRAAIGRALGLRRSQVGNILSGRCWRHP